MIRAIRRLGVVPAATMLFGSLFTLTAPAASADCGSGTPFQGATVGAPLTAEQNDYWMTETVGQTTITLTSNDSAMDFHAYGENCEVLCDIATQCTFNHTGTVGVLVHDGIGPYVLRSTTGSGVPSLPPNDGCNLVDLAGVCVGLDAGDEIERVTVREPVVGFNEGPGVIGRVEQWRLPLPTGGSVLLPCVVLTVGGLGSNGCSLIGASYVSTVALLVDQDVPIPTAGFGDVLATAGLCEATLTATVVGFGIEDFPAVSLC